MNRIRRYTIFLCIALAIPVLCLFYGYFEARNIIVKEIVFQHDDIPSSFAGKTIIFISDTHCDKYFNGEDVEKLVTRINQRNPDFIFLGGDYTKKAPEYSDAFFAAIAKLKSTYGIFSVMGNHDFWEDAELIRNGLAGCGINICDNRSYWIKEGNDSIKIGGVGDLWDDVQHIENTVEDVEKKDFCILLSHNPDYIELLDTDKVDLMLSGHTHAGQVTVFGLFAPIMPPSFHPEYMNTGQKYRYGWKEKDNTKLYVTSGIGMGGFPFRFFANPEIVEITLAR